MRHVAYAALAVLLSSLPGEQVLAQATPDDVARIDVSLPNEEAPPLEPASREVSSPAALLWQPVVENEAAHSSGRSFEAAPPRAWSDWSTEKKVLIVGGGVLALIILGIVSIG